VTSRRYWPRRGHILWWKKMEVSLIVCGYSWPHYFLVGRIVCGENRRLVQSNTAPSHLLTLAFSPAHPNPDSPSPTDPDALARRRLIKHNSPPREVKVISHHSGDTTQKSIDVINKVVRISSHMPQFPTLTAHDPSLTTRDPSQGYPPCLPPVPRPCDNSIASTSFHLIFQTNFATYSMGWSICNVWWTSRTMIWCGWLSI